VPLRLAILFPQQEQNPSKDRHFRAFPAVSPLKIRRLLKQRG